MADNVQFTAGSGPGAFKTDEVSTNVHVPYTKLDVGANDASTPLVGKSNNAGAPGATNIGTLPGVASVANPAYTEGNQVAISLDLSGRQRTMVPKVQSSGTLNMTSGSNTLEVPIEGINGLAFTITGSWTGILKFRTIAPDNSTNFFLAGFNMSNEGGTNFTNDFETQTTANGTWIATGIGGFAKIRFDASTPTTLGINSITRSGSTATATTASAHGLITGSRVNITGATQTEYNGTFVATVTGTTTFTYTVSGTPATPATGTPILNYGTGTATINWCGTGQSDYVFTQTFGDLKDNTAPESTYAVWPVIVGGICYSALGASNPTSTNLPAARANGLRTRQVMSAYGEALVQQIDHHYTGSISTNTGVFGAPTLGAQAVSVNITGTWNPGTGNYLTFEQSDNGTDYYVCAGLNCETLTGALDVASGAAGAQNANGTWRMILTGGAAYVRVRHVDADGGGANAWTSGTANIVIRCTNGHPIQYTLISGDKNHDAADSLTAPIKLGARATSFSSTPVTAVGSDDRTNLYATRAGQLFTLGGSPHIVTLEANYTAAQTNVAVVTASGTEKIVVTQIQVLVSNATTVSPQCRVGFATATTPTTTGVVLTHPGISPGGGVSRGDGAGVLGAGALDEDLRITCDAPTSGALRVLVSYFIIAG